MNALDRMLAYRFPLQRRAARLRTKYLRDLVFVHINKTGGSSIERALALPFQHLTALELRDLLGERRWSRRFKFTFVRDPWDKVASHYHFRVKTNQTGLRTRPIPFPEWVVRAYGERDPVLYDDPKMFMPQYRWICAEDGRSLVDFIGRFEHLREDFREVCRRIGVKAELPHLKKSADRSYRLLYTPEARQVVAQRFAGDLERFGYTFDR